MDGLAPAIAIKQKNQTRNPRSTVATATEIYDYLRLLYARCGTVTCLHCGGIVKRDTVDEVVATMLALPEGTRVYALFPIVRAEIKLEPLEGSSNPDIKPEPPRRRTQSRKKVRSQEAPEHRRRYPYRISQRAPARASPARLQPPFPADRRPESRRPPGRNRRVLHSRVAARTRLLTAHFRPRRPPRTLARSPQPPGRRHRDRLPRVRRNPVPHPRRKPGSRNPLLLRL